MFRLVFLAASLVLTTAFAKEAELPTAGQEVEAVKVEGAEVEKSDLYQQLFHAEQEEVESALKREALAADVVGARPTPEGTPTKVKVGLYFHDIFALDDAEQTVTASVRLTARWLDPRLADPLTKEIREIPVNNAWNPLISIANRRDVKPEFEDSIFVDPEGHVFMVQRYYGTFTAPLNLKDFPLDKHRLHVTVKSFYGADDLELLIDKKLTGWPEKLSIPDWIVSNGDTRISTVYDRTQDREVVQFDFTFEIERRVGFYYRKIIIPLALIVAMSWGVFWIDPRKLEAMVGLSATAFLTLFAFQFAISALLPRIAYLTRIDFYTMFSSLLVFAALLESLTVYFLTRNDRDELAIKIDYTCRFMFPLVFLGFVTYAFFT